MSGASVLVVGAGPVGLAAAWHLALGGAEVVVVGRNPRLGLDTASGSAGVITPSHCVPLAGPRVVRNLPGWLLRRSGLRALRDQARAGGVLWEEDASTDPQEVA